MRESRSAVAYLIKEDRTPKDIASYFQSGRWRLLKLELGRRLYPYLNAAMKRWAISRLRRLDPVLLSNHSPNAVAWGKKGFGNEIFLQEVAARVRRNPVVACFGCGMGQEVLALTRFLCPRKIIGYEYFNYKKSWDHLKSRLALGGVEVEFKQVDLRRPLPRSCEPVDLLISFNVVEHLGKMDATFENLRGLLAPDGSFASIWSPLWPSYSGDHISAEMGMQFAFEHLRLSPQDYLEWYKRHPRNRSEVESGKPTWLELGLHNYADVRSYLESIRASFGPVKWMKWQVSREAFHFRRRYPERWAEVLQKNSRIKEIDLVLGGVALLAGPAREAHG